MKKREYAQAIDHMIPETPQVFKQAMERTLSQIAAASPAEREAAAKPVFTKRRALVFVLAALLLAATLAVAANHWNLFEALSFMTGASPKNADQVMRGNLLSTTVNNVEITVKEAGYDGKTLFIQYSYRMLDVDTPLGMYRPEYADYPDDQRGGIGEGDLQLLADHHVGWWIDHLWIDGKCVDMPNNSGADTSGSPVPGEIVQTEYWRLDNVDMKLSGKVAISLPIGERQPLQEYYSKEHPEKYGEDGNLLLPDKGIVTFALDTADTLAKVRYDHPNLPVRGENVTAQVSEACYSPLMTYITLKLEGDADAIAAYKAENGLGFYSEDGKTLLWEYGGMDVFGNWVSNLMLVDGDGKELFPDTYGNNGYGNEWAEFVYPYIETMPKELYLAPVTDGVANMEQAVKVH